MPLPEFFFEIIIPNVFAQFMFKVLSQKLRGTLETAFLRQRTIEDFMDMDQHRCRAGTKIFELLVYASVSFKQA